MAYEQEIRSRRRAHDWSPVDETGRSKSSTDIEEDIGHTRQEMDAIVDEIGRRIHPKRMLNQAFDTFQRRSAETGAPISEAGRRLSDAVQSNPVPYILAGVGLAWMIYDLQSRPEEKTGEPGEAIGRTRDQAAETWRSGAESIKGKTGQAQETLKEAGREFKGRMESATGRIEEKYRRSAKKADRLFDQNPLAVGLISMLAGSLVAMLVPETRKEEEMFGPKATELKQTASEKAEQAGAKGKEVMKEAATAGTEKAKREGLTPEQAKKTTQEKTEELVHH